MISPKTQPTLTRGLLFSYVLHRTRTSCGFNLLVPTSEVLRWRCRAGNPSVSRAQVQRRRRIGAVPQMRDLSSHTSWTGYADHVQLTMSRFPPRTYTAGKGLLDSVLFLGL